MSDTTTQDSQVACLLAYKKKHFRSITWFIWMFILFLLIWTALALVLTWISQDRLRPGNLFNDEPVLTKTGKS